jgi:hypothetical protein
VHLKLTGPACTQTNFDAEYEVHQDGNPVSGLNVKFTYNGVVKYGDTNQDGKALVSFTYSGPGDVVAEPNGNFDTQTRYISGACQGVSSEDPKNHGQILGLTTSSNGKVLAATTMADTGIFEDTLMSLVGMIGAGLTATGSLLYAKKRTSK